MPTNKISVTTESNSEGILIENADDIQISIRLEDGKLIEYEIAITDEGLVFDYIVNENIQPMPMAYDYFNDHPELDIQDEKELENFVAKCRLEDLGLTAWTGICPRCAKKSKFYTVSIFEPTLICPVCKKEEKLRPNYQDVLDNLNDSYDRSDHET